MPGLRVDHHRIDGQRIDLPLPPVAAATPALVQRIVALEHQPFHAAFACQRALRGRGRPVAGLQRGREHDARIIQCLQQGGQACATGVQRLRAQVLAVDLQQVIGEHTHRRIAQCLRPRLATLDARLQRGERQRLRLAVAPRQQLAIDHAAVGQRHGRRLDFREAPVQAFFATRPQCGLALAAQQLQADAIPLPFQHPVGDRSEALDVGLQR